MNSVFHFHIPVNDIKRAKEFYEKNFGWCINKMSDYDYYRINIVGLDGNKLPKGNGVINGGMLKREGNEQVMIVIEVNSIDEILKKVIKNKGKIIFEKQKIGEIGYYARFEDTERNIVALWQSIEP
jgi:uncharacterized protein